MTDQEIQQILDLHNGYRNRTASGAEREAFKFPSASNMLQVQWDQELADIAQIHATQCEFEHDCNQCRQVDDYQVGQNLYQRRTSWHNPTPDWSKAISSFYEEIGITPLKVLSKFKGGPHGHFTQVVWADTWKIGCGYSAFKINDSLFKTEEIYVCNYGPSGNLRGQKMYKKGPSTSRCPFNTAPSTEFTALCKSLTPAGPQEIDVESVRTSNKTLFYCDFRNDSVCGLRIAHNNNSFLVDGLLGDYLSFILQAGERVTIRLPSELRSPRGFCISSVQRKGTTLAGTSLNSKLRIELRIREFNWFTELDFGKDSLEWTKTNVNVNWGHSTAVKITFEVPANAEEQFYEIKRLLITEGRCK